MEAMKLVLMGVTILVSSGDDGVSNDNCDVSSDEVVYSGWKGTNSWTGYGYVSSGISIDSSFMFCTLIVSLISRHLPVCNSSGCYNASEL